MTLYLAGTAIIAAGGVFSFVFSEKYKNIIVSVFAAAGGLTAILSCADFLSGGAAVNTAFFRIDGLSAFFAVLISFSGAFACFYAGPYMKKYHSKAMGTASHFFFLPVLIASMLLVVVSSHAVSFIFFWEIMALSSFFLAAFDSSKKEVFEASIYYLIMSHISGALLIAGFLLASGEGLSFAAFHGFLASRPALSAAVFTLLFAGFAVKAGLVPLHTWLPAAHPAAPSHISGLMSGVMIKTGIYGMIRLLEIIPAQGIYASYTVTSIGLITAALAGIYTMTQRDYKRVLAYSSIENMGIITAGIGITVAGRALEMPAVSALALSGVLVHAFNHSLIKSMLFFASGEVYGSVHTRDMEHLGGLGKKLPLTAFSFLTGSAAASGLPVLNGFPGKFLIYLALISAAGTGNAAAAPPAVAAMAVLALAGASALIGFVRLYGVVFSGNPRSEAAKNCASENKPAGVMLAVMAGLCFISGVFPQLLLKISSAAAGTDAAVSLDYLTILSLGIISFTAVIYLIMRAVLSGRTSRAPVWGCGYGAPSERMQYSAYSFSEPFLKTAEPVLHKIKEEKLPSGVFPETGSYSAKYTDVPEKTVIKPAGYAVEMFLKKFAWIQSGNTQKYIIYGLVFLVLSLALAVMS